LTSQRDLKTSDLMSTRDKKSDLMTANPTVVLVVTGSVLKVTVVAVMGTLDAFALVARHNFARFSFRAF
jgi:hypothetical protein